LWIFFTVSTTQLERTLHRSKMRLRRPEKSWGIDAHANPHFSPFAFSLPLSLDVPANHTHTELLRAGEEYLCDWTLLQSTPARNFFFGQVQNLSVTRRSRKAADTEFLRAGSDLIRDGKVLAKHQPFFWLAIYVAKNRKSKLKVLKDFQ
jgi:hypothetical protein